MQATIYYDETEEREEGADLEELIRDGQIAFSERSFLALQALGQLHVQALGGASGCAAGRACSLHVWHPLLVSAAAVVFLPSWMGHCSRPLMCRGAATLKPRVPQGGD